MTPYHEAKGICSRDHGSFVDTKAARKRAKGQPCGKPLIDRRQLFFVCSEECAIKSGIIW